MSREINDVVMVSACRTAIGDYLGSLKSVRANQLSAIAGAEALKRAGIDPKMIDELVLGMCLHHGNGSLPPRQVAMAIGMDVKSGACEISQNCASGMRATEIAAMSLMLGKTDIALVIGTESMSNIPYLLQNARSGYRMGPGKLEDAMLSDGLVCALAQGHMGTTADRVAEIYGITRQECDELALMSHMRANAGVAAGVFKREIVPVEIPGKKGITVFDTDEHPIKDPSLDKMAKLPPAFNKNGVTTAANASGLNDASAAAVFMTRKKADELGIKPLMKLINVCTEGVDAKVMGLGPAVAIPKCLKQAGMKYKDVDYWEINEAFAAQVLGVKKLLRKEYGIDMSFDNVNLNGSGIALGHPVGCTALRIIVSLYYELERQGKTTGGASLCVGGGPGMASLWTRDI
ncbi:MAG: thiolase family protein [Deltaproteobacteria bacterium]